MPFTPFHFGLGGLTGGYGSRWFSFRAFCFANVLIDTEALYRLPLMLYPVHDWMHTFLIGGLVPLLLWYPIGRPFCLWVSRWWNNLALGGVLEKIHIPNKIETRPALIGLVFGGLSHIFLDSIMHSDISPLMPFSYDNPFYMIIKLSHLHYLLTLSGLVGIGLMFTRCRRK